MPSLKLDGPFLFGTRGHVVSLSYGDWLFSVMTREEKRDGMNLSRVVGPL